RQRVQSFTHFFRQSNKIRLFIIIISLLSPSRIILSSHLRAEQSSPPVTFFQLAELVANPDHGQVDG
ncbi:hypothetical protein KSS87_019750, partial [Heliosperma pusillum]